MPDSNLVGQLLISQPCCKDPNFVKSVVLLAQYSATGGWGIVVNRDSKSVIMQNVMAAAGIDHDIKNCQTVYVGGPVEPTRVQVVHTMDWSSSATLQITEDLGITGDVSVLAAISQNQGPRLFRAGVGLSMWGPGQLEGEQRGISPWTPDQRWLTVPASIDLVLTGMGDEQWHRALEASVRLQVKELF